MGKDAEWSEDIAWLIDRVLVSAALGLVAGGFVAVRSYLSMRRVTESARADLGAGLATFVGVFVVTILVGFMTGNGRKHPR